ncbi:MAG: citramalate synthase [Chloroflexi bacterium]|nr:citramalate synthase [Chloroflexota bacterium]|tara:strand:- start:4360 stop:5982 length:1623 start_codon:yes stop_codon:yes gene_type:complete
MNKLELYDTTLRDGTQQQGISLSVEDKIAITIKLDDLGVDFIEGGYAGANPKDDEYFKKIFEIKLKNAKIAAFGNTRKANTHVAKDQSIIALLKSKAKILTLVGKSSAFQVEKILETTLEENLSMIEDSIKFLTQNNREVFFDAEHFFDGYKENPEYSIQSLKVAINAGAKRIILCDTNGGTLPDEIGKIVSKVKSSISDTILGIHTHNDTDTAVASSLAAVESGASHIQACVNGYGERTGNANMISIIGNLSLKMGYETIQKSKISSLTEVSNFVSERVNRRPFPFQPFVGSSAFTHKGGLHASATQKIQNAYQHIDPKIVGNLSGMVVSELSGKSNILKRVSDLNLNELIDVKDANKIVNLIKQNEAKGFTYEGTEASLDLILYKHTPNYEPAFTLIDFMVIVENKRRSSFGSGWRNDRNEHPMLSEATVKIQVDQDIRHTVAEGNGPIDALDKALRKGLINFYPSIEKIRLTDYKVRVVNEENGTGAIVRVLIESADDRKVWQTVGASSNIIEASWMALSDSIEWWLINNDINRKLV